MARFFLFPALVSLAILVAVFFWSGVAAFLTVAALSILEITLSFDNAVVNAQVLKQMSPLWQKRFLTWGMLVAVGGTRLVLPIFLVSLTAWVSPWLAVHLAFFDSAQYAVLISGARYAIGAFGGAFLAMISLRYFLDEGKTVHWIHAVERHLARWGDIEALEIALVLGGVVVAALLAVSEARSAILLAGVIGIVLSVGIESVMRALSVRGKGVAAGIGLFIYLNVLDSAFSLDGVVGAFALTTSIPFIVIGLGIGAYFVRSLTLYLTEHKVLDSLVFIEHGAYWAIFGLALSMFVGLVVEVPAFVTGLVGLLFMIAAYVSSVRATRS